MKRGEIYYIARRETIGAEIAKARPGIIVSSDALNANSEVVMIVYLTTQPKREMPTHVTIESSGLRSTAICEHIDHVSKMLVGDYCGTCSDEEMDAINLALLAALGIELSELDDVEETHRDDTELVKACAERDVYKALVDKLIGASER